MINIKFRNNENGPVAVMELSTIPSFNENALEHWRSLAPEEKKSEVGSQELNLGLILGMITTIVPIVIQLLVGIFSSFI